MVCYPQITPLHASAAGSFLAFWPVSGCVPVCQPVFQFIGTTNMCAIDEDLRENIEQGESTSNSFINKIDYIANFVLFYRLTPEPWP
jgi:hypothetical protein